MLDYYSGGGDDAHHHEPHEFKEYFDRAMQPDVDQETKDWFVDQRLRWVRANQVFERILRKLENKKRKRR